MTLTSASLAEFRVIWGRSLEEKVIKKIVLNKWRSRAIGASSWGAPAAAGPVEVDVNEANCAAG
jgi:hypothetical protein